MNAEDQASFETQWPRAVALSKAQPSDHRGCWGAIIALNTNQAKTELEAFITYEVITNLGADVSWDRLRLKLRRVRFWLNANHPGSTILGSYEAQDHFLKRTVVNQGMVVR